MSLRSPQTTARRARELRELETSGAPPKPPQFSEQPSEIQEGCAKLAEMHDCDVARAWKYVVVTMGHLHVDAANSLSFLLESYRPKPWTQDPPSWTE